MGQRSGCDDLASTDRLGRHIRLAVRRTRYNRAMLGMRLEKKLVLVGSCILTLGALGLAFAAGPSREAQAGPSTAKPVVARSTATTVDTATARMLHQAKVAEAADAALSAFEVAIKDYAAGTGSLETAAEWAKRAHGAGKSNDPDKDTIDRLKRLEAIAKQRIASGTSTAIDAHAARYHRTRAEAEALR